MWAVGEDKILVILSCFCFWLVCVCHELFFFFFLFCLSRAFWEGSLGLRLGLGNEGEEGSHNRGMGFCISHHLFLYIVLALSSHPSHQIELHLHRVPF